MNVEIGAKAALFPEKEYINGIFVAVKTSSPISSISGTGEENCNIFTVDYLLLHQQYPEDEVWLEAAVAIQGDHVHQRL
jgi:hypothetical protein